jgi:hypothetical protein
MLPGWTVLAPINIQILDKWQPRLYARARQYSSKSLLN